MEEAPWFRQSSAALRGRSRPGQVGSQTPLYQEKKSDRAALPLLLMYHSSCVSAAAQLGKNLFPLGSWQLQLKVQLKVHTGPSAAVSSLPSGRRQL